MSIWDTAKGLLPGVNAGREKEERDFGPSGAALIPRRTTGFMPQPAVYISEDTAMRVSAVWACVRLRANLISTMPVNTFRYVGPHKLATPKPPIMTNADGSRIDFHEFLYMSQVELDRSGNFIGIIREFDGNNNPSRIDAVASTDVKILVRKGELAAYNIAGTEYKPDVIWHERQYPVAGSFVGLSPVAYAAYAIGEYESIRQFTTEWFQGGAVPRARLRNTQTTFTDEEALLVKESWKASVNMGEPFVHGNDWEYDLMQAGEASADWVKAKELDIVDIARFFDCPAAMIDAAVSGENVTYQNVTQRNLEFLIMHLGPTITRREIAMSKLLARPRFVEFDSDSLLRMDPMTRAEYIAKKIDSRVMTPSEARAMDSLPPLTPDQYEEFFKAGLVHGKSVVMPGSPDDPNANPDFSSQFQSPQ